MIIQNAVIYRNGILQIGTLFTEGERIRESSGGDVLEADGLFAFPGLIDTHFHGADGADFSDGTAESLRKLLRYELEHGITAVCPATMSLPEEQLMKIMRAAGSYEGEGAELVGIHLEGPFLNPVKCGAQDPKAMIPADADLVKRLDEACGQLIRIVDIAPEMPGAMEAIPGLSDHYRVSLAHTAADYETAKEAFRAGADRITHLFNAMNGIHHRNPGPAAAAAESASCAELICDGIHVHPAMVRLAFDLFGDSRIVMISDSMRGTGLADGVYTLGGQRVRKSGNRAVMEHDSGVIAGSVSDLYDCLRTAVGMGIPMESALRACTENPARSIGIDDDYGSLDPGKYADIILADRNLEIKMILHHGRIIERSEDI